MNAYQQQFHCLGYKLRCSNLRCDEDEPQNTPFPGDFNSKLSGFKRLLVVKTLREEKLQFACGKYVEEKLGKQFVEPEPWSLDDVFPDTSARTPIIFVLSTGKDHRQLISVSASPTVSTKTERTCNSKQVWKSKI